MSVGLLALTFLTSLGLGWLPLFYDQGAGDGAVA